MVSTFDTVMCVTLTNRAEHMKGRGPDSAEITDRGQTRWEPACLCIFTCDFICFYVRPLVCLSVSLSVWGCFIATAMLLRLWPRRQKGIHEQTGTKFPWFPPHVVFFSQRTFGSCEQMAFGSSFLMNGHNLLFAEVIIFQGFTFDMYIWESYPSRWSKWNRLSCVI